MKLITDIIYGMILTFTNKQKLDNISKSVTDLLEVDAGDLV
jgi:hypothetical protein